MIKLLAFLTIYSCFHGALVNAGTFRTPAKNLPNSVRILENQYIIELTAPPSAISDKQSSSKSVEAEQDQLRRDMQSVGIKFQETGTFSTLYNGIYASLSEDDARKVATLQGVKNVWPVLGHTRTPAATGGVGRDQHAHNMTFVNQVRGETAHVLIFGALIGLNCTNIWCSAWLYWKKYQSWYY
ncbi:hypothetical protein BKA69DRAFT_1095618 [Paraphysoderma sedebokerense]|nr:hypothetical protein BKA69DRAFT_1095618 [Paraphysoderma sedebokerense]